MSEGKGIDNDGERKQPGSNGSTFDVEEQEEADGKRKDSPKHAAFRDVKLGDKRLEGTTFEGISTHEQLDALLVGQFFKAGAFRDRIKKKRTCFCCSHLTKKGLRSHPEEIAEDKAEVEDDEYFSLPSHVGA